MVCSATPSRALVPVDGLCAVCVVVVLLLCAFVFVLVALRAFARLLVVAEFEFKFLPLLFGVELRVIALDPFNLL